MDLSAADLLDVMPDGVVVADDRGLVTFANPRAARLLGRPPEDIVGTPVQEALPLLDDAGHSWWNCIDPWGGLATRTGHRERMLLVPGRGHLLVTMSFVRAGRLQPVQRVIVALRDTDARRRAEAQSSELMSLVAHELRSPLTSVKGFSSTLLRRWHRFDDAQKHLMIETIEADADRLARLIRELLDVSRLDTGRLRLDRARVDVAARVSWHVDRFVAAGSDPSRFVVSDERPRDEAGSRPAAWADTDRLDQVLSNLLENALRHGEGLIRVRISYAQEELPRSPYERSRPGDPTPSGTIVVRVSDEGAGIPPEHYPLVFMKFWHGSQRGSTGLGLYLVRGLVEARGGVVTVDRGEHGGAEFTFSLPAVPCD